MTVPESDDETSSLNKLGAEGWEVTSFAPAKWAGNFSYSVKEYTFCAKRALP